MTAHELITSLQKMSPNDNVFIIDKDHVLGISLREINYVTREDEESAVILDGE